MRLPAPLCPGHTEIGVRGVLPACGFENQYGMPRGRAAHIRMQAATLEVAPDAPMLPFRVGHGWDLHRLETGYPLIIGGVNIPHERGCVAHSDGENSL